MQAGSDGGSDREAVSVCVCVCARVRERVCEGWARSGAVSREALRMSEVCARAGACARKRRGSRGVN